MNSSKQEFKVKRIVFLLDVLKLAITAFGGAQMHFTQFYKHLVLKRKYINEDELKEINSLCSMLPGPSSTQTIAAIGFKVGGSSLAFLTLAVWILPATLIMIIFAIVVAQLDISNPKLHFLKYIQPMAVGFIIYAAYQIKNIFISKSFHWVLMLSSALLAIVLQTPYVFPFLLIVGGFVSTQINKADYHNVKPIKNIDWRNLLLLFLILSLAALIGAITKSKAVILFENTYRFGTIVFGGGHVLIPMMYNQFVEFKNYISPNDFLAGVGVLQAVPGPVFSISTYTGAMILRESGILGQLLGGVIGTIAIFLPGILLIFFVYPIWDKIKNYSPVKNTIEGINAVSAGLVLASAYMLFQPVEINQANMLVLLGTLFLLLTTKLPSPIIVLMCIIVGIAF